MLHRVESFRPALAAFIVWGLGAGCIEPTRTVLPANDAASDGVGDAELDTTPPEDIAEDTAPSDIEDSRDGAEPDSTPADVAPPGPTFRFVVPTATRSYFIGQSLRESFSVIVEIDEGEGFRYAGEGVRLQFQRRNADGTSWRDAGPVSTTDEEGWAYSDYWEDLVEGGDVHFRFILEAEREAPRTIAEFMAFETRLAGLALGAGHACARTDASDLFCWGYNGPPTEDGAEGDRPMTLHTWVDRPTSAEGYPRVDYPAHVPIPGQRWGDAPLPAGAALLSVAVAGHVDPQGHIHGAATCISIGPTNRNATPVESEHLGVWCVGSNADHRLGDNSTAPATDWVRVQFSADGTRRAMPPAAQLIGGGDHFCAIIQSGLSRDVYCWGSNEHGQLAMPPGGSPAVAVPVTLPSPLDGTGSLVPLTLVAGRTGTCAVVSDIALTSLVQDLLSLDTDVFCWGRGADNQFGVLGREGQMGPLRMPIEHVCEEEKSLPEGAQLRFSSGGLGGHHACALVELVVDDAAQGIETACNMSVGTPRVVCTGTATKGRRGIALPDEGTVVVPPIGFGPLAEPPLEAFESLGVGEAFACGATRGDNAYCWGDNAAGQLGTATASADFSADALKVQFASGTIRVHAVAAGPNYACAATSDDAAAIPDAVTLMCWGDNTFGQSGAGCEATRGTPACEGPSPRPVVMQ